MGTRKGASKAVTVFAVLALLGTVLGALHFSDNLSVASAGEQCWHEVQHNNRTFNSEQELRNYASNIGVSIPGNVTFKTINGTLHQECQFIGGRSG